MSIDNGTCQLSFPWNGEIPPQGTLILKDVEVVGVGSLRRQQLESLQSSKNIILQTHASLIPESIYDIYQAELLRTTEWLRPFKEETVQTWNFVQEQKYLFSKIFPKTEKALGLAAQKTRDLYLQEMEWSSWLLQDHWRYFVGFLRQRFSDNQELLELAHWEWVRAWIEVQPFDLHSFGERGYVALNPSLQVVSLHKKNEMLNRDQGVYVFVFNPQRSAIVEKKLDIYEAQFLDLMQEERKYTVQQLLDMASLEEQIKPQLSSVEWEKKFVSLVDEAILINVSS